MYFVADARWYQLYYGWWTEHKVMEWAGNTGSDPYPCRTGVTYTTEVNDAIAGCRQRALLKFSEHSVDLSVAYAERQKTANFVTDVMKKVRNIAKKARRMANRSNRRTSNSGLSGKKKATKRWASFADAWMSYRYAWTPLVLDVYDAIEAIENRDNGTYNRYLVSKRSGKRLRTVSSNTQNSSIGVCYPAFTYTLSRVGKETVTTDVKVRYDAYLTGASYKRLVDVGVTNPYTTLWELMPYSFVVDWFLGVGDFLEGCNALAGYTFLAGSQTVAQTASSSTSWVPPPTLTNSQLAPSVSYESKSFHFSRTVLPEPTSQLLLKSNPLNLERFMDSLSLLKNIFGRR
jgi:hypothetical protein